MATKQELLAIAKEYAIVGRHEMTKEQLETAVSLAQSLASGEVIQTGEIDGEPQYSTTIGMEDAESDEDNEAIEDGSEETNLDDELDDITSTAAVVDPEVVKDAKRRYPSSAKRGEDGKVIRKGVKFNLNTPFRRKFYYLDGRVTKAAGWDQAVKAAPPQVRAMVEAMVKEGCTVPSESRLGHEIADMAKSRGLQTKIDSAMLFAYYRRVMERLGVTHNIWFEQNEGDDE